jgi:activator of HSP90 ATPase
MFYVKLKMKSFKKYFSIKANNASVYNALVNKDVIELWSDSEVVFEEKDNTEFSLYDGDIVGKNISFVKDKQIVQEWYFDNPKGEESIVTIKIHADKQFTSLEVNQTNIPDDAFENISEGWEYGIIECLKEILEEV